MPDKPKVPCLDCGTPVHSAVARARRIGSGCWRKRRALARAQVTPVALPGLSRPGRATGQAGPHLLDGLTDVDQAGVNDADVDEAQP
ncbi:hypothetical protein [Micromonospora sp. RTGN7]|uniref:hypothetical protein n=1 Tax=Micromonospora sp. RTGN7 TaxID=3016526 RepID=UPI0029FED7B1|nr:hypothetical protein [Micromonospora sp. RTGN7]